MIESTHYPILMYNSPSIGCAECWTLHHNRGTWERNLPPTTNGKQRESIVERVSGTHLKPYIAVHNGNEKEAKREMIAQKILLHWNVK